MKVKIMIALTLASASLMASAADEYICKVYCNEGTTNVTVRADSKKEAAYKVDQECDKICKNDNRGKASNETMRPEQCSRK